MAEISIRQIETENQIEAVRDLVREFFEFAATVDPDAKNARGFQGLDEELAALPGKYAPPEGAFLLASVDEAPAGCLAFFRHDATLCEVKRMFVRPEFRGLRLGETLVDELLRRARARGYRKIILSTFYKLEAAQRIYAKAGFAVCPPHFEVEEAHKGKIVFMDREL